MGNIELKGGKMQEKVCSICGSKFHSDDENETVCRACYIKANQLLMDEAKGQASKEALKGVLWFVGALLITLITFLGAEPGGSYYIFWGAMLYGVYRLIRGLYYLANPEALIKKVIEKMEE